MKKITFIMLLCSALTLWWGCSSSDNDPATPEKPEVAEKPNWNIDLTGNDNVPSWSVKDDENYELSMSISIKLNPILAKYASKEDQIAAFVGDECRGTTTLTLHDTGDITPLASAGITIMGNAQEQGVTFKYYCAQLRRIFTLPNWINYNPNQSPSESGSSYTLPFEEEQGLTSYQLTLALPSGCSVDLSAGDEIAALTPSNECRSTLAWVSDNAIGLNVLAQQGTQLTISLYDADKKTIKKISESFTVGNDKTINLKGIQ